MKTTPLLVAALAALSLCACSSNDGNDDVDAGVDAAVDAGRDAGADPGSDPGTDAGADTGSDAGADAAADEDTPARYAGSQQCAGCHAEKASAWQDTAHANALKKIEAGAAPSFPVGTSPWDPSGLDFSGFGGLADWQDVSYLIGGFGWMAQFVDGDGYLYTGDADHPAARLILADGSTAPGRTGEQVPFDCAACHTTGFDPGGAPQGGLAGMTGSWSEEGVACEACHGPGAEHARSHSAPDITGHPGPEVCAGCHSRDPQHRIEVRNGYVASNAHFDELATYNQGRDAPKVCTDCHDPHHSVLYDRDHGIRQACSACHTPSTNTIMASLDCSDCHMAPTGRLAAAAGPHEGDLHSHLLVITASAADPATYPADGSDWSHPYITLDFACLRCHTDQDIDWAEAKTAECLSCH